MASVTVIELLQDTAEHESHVWIELEMEGHKLTIRVDPCTMEGLPDGFNVFLAADYNEDISQPLLAGSSLTTIVRYEKR